MFPEVHSALTLDKHNLEATTTHVAILESESLSGSLFTHHLLSFAMQNEGAVLFLGLEQSLGHYHSVAMKNGLNLLKARSTGRFVFLEGLTNISRAYGNTHYDPDYSFVKFPRMEQTLADLFFSFNRQILEMVKMQLMYNKYVFIDKVSVFTNLGIAPLEVIAFLRYVYDVCKLYMINTVFATRTDEENGSLEDFLKEHSTMTIETWPLKTGRTAGVSGNFRFEWKEFDEYGRFQYSVSEKEVRVFALGASKSVL